MNETALQIRLSVELLDQIRDRAEHEGLSVSAWVRTTLLRVLREGQPKRKR